MSSHEAIPRDSTGAPGRIEIITGHERRRRYSDEDKARLVAEAAQPGQGVHAVSRRHGVCSSLLYRWRRDSIGARWPAAPTQRLIPVQVAAEHREAPAPPRPETVRVERLVEITLPNGCSVRVVDALERHVMAGDRIHADDTPVPVLAPGTGKTKTGRLWAYVRDERPHGGPAPPAAVYRYSPDRKGEHPRLHLAGFAGVLHADGYAGFEGLYQAGRVIEAACWAHVRRHFFDLHAMGKSPLASEALLWIQCLYAVEDDVRGRPPDERRRVRKARAEPLLAEMRAWLEATLGRVSRRGDLAKAIRYALTRWTALTCYVDDGRIEIDNNAVERAIRPIALGRKNWLFAGSDTGSARAAAIASLVSTARLNGLNPEAYLRHVLERIAEHPARQVAELLPWNCAEFAPATALQDAA